MRLGEFDWTDDKEQPPHEDFAIEKAIIHGDFNRAGSSFDIALIKLDREVELKPHILPIYLPPKAARFEGKIAKISGWGETTPRRDTPRLQEALLRVNPCEEAWTTAEELIHGMVICAGRHGRDNTFGDSGGPLSILERGWRVLIGVTSTNAYANTTQQGKYTSVADHLEWIRQMMNQLNLEPPCGRLLSSTSRVGSSD